MWSKKRELSTILLLAMTTMVLPSYVSADFEAVINIANQFNNSGQCSCYSSGKKCADFSYGDNFDTYLSGKLDDWGYDRVTRAYRTAVSFSNWADYTRTTAGDDNRDPYGVDSADVGLLYTHGGINSAETAATVLMGDASEDCSLTYGKNSAGNEVQWGDADLNYLIIYACNSLHRNLFLNDAFLSSTIRSSKMAMMLGMHGYMWDGKDHYNKFKGFVDGVRANGLGDDWVDEMSKTSGSYKQCATALVWASDSATADNVYSYAGFMDLKTSGTGYMAYHYISGCTPSGAPQLPQ